MARSFLHTFSDSKYFEDRRGKPYAHPITERINVSAYFSISAPVLTENSQPHSRPIVSYYFPKGVGEHHYGVSDFFPIRIPMLTFLSARKASYETA